MDPAVSTERPLPGRGTGSTCSSRRRRDRGRTCAPRTAMSSRSLRSAPSGLEENAVADRKVRSRRRQRSQPGGTGQVGRAQRLWGRGRAGAVGAGGVGAWPAARGLGVPGASRPARAQQAGRTEGLRSRDGHGWGSMRDCGGNRKEPVRIGVESLTSAVYASALRALCVLVRGVSTLRAGPGPSEP